MFSNRTASVFIERNGAKYINEPHAGGGNPVFAIGGDGQKPRLYLQIYSELAWAR